MMFDYSTITADPARAAAAHADYTARIGEVDRWGRITQTLVGVETTEMLRNGRTYYIVKPLHHTRDPLVNF